MAWFLVVYLIFNDFLTDVLFFKNKQSENVAKLHFNHKPKSIID